MDDKLSDCWHPKTEWFAKSRPDCLPFHDSLLRTNSSACIDITDLTHAFCELV